MTTQSTPYSHGTYSIEDDRIHIICHTPRLVLPENVPIDLRSILGIRRSGGYTHFIAKVKQDTVAKPDKNDKV